MSGLEAERKRDAAARRAAQTHFEAPLVLEAGAGTGKTTVLIARVLAWCLGVGWARAERHLGDAPPDRIAERVLERVVAITFTEAAAAEMESRAIDAFSQVARGAPAFGLDAELLGIERSAGELRARALLAAFDHLRFQTIHAFCRRLLGAYSLEAGLHPRFVVDARGSERARVVRELLEERLREVARAGDPDLEALLLEGMGAPELETVLLALAAAAVPADAFLVDPFAPERVRDWVSAVARAAEAFAAAEGGRLGQLRESAVGRRTARAVTATRDAVARGAEKLVELAVLVASLRTIWSEADPGRLAKWARDDFAEMERRALAGAPQPAFADACARLFAEVGRLDEIDPARLAVVHRVLAPLLVRIEQRLAEVGAESFDALLRDTRDLLAGNPAVAAEVRGEIDQLLVDEFQDTDRFQCEIVAALALGGDDAMRPGLFLVGDPKQSVYGWRNADIGAYMRFVARTLAVPGAERHVLCVNHRSVPALLAEVERVVAPVMREEAGVQPAFQRGVASERHARVDGSGTPGVPAVEYWWTAPWDTAAGAFAKAPAADLADLEARHLAADLRRLSQRGVHWKDVAVLLRSSGDLDRYLSALRDAGIPHLVDRDRDYYQRREVRDAAALVCSVLDPNDQLALVATLRSAWVGVPDAAWRPLWARDFPLAARHALDGDAEAQARIRTMAAEVAREIAVAPGLAELAGWEKSLENAIEVLAALRRSFETEPVDGFLEALRVRTLLEATEAARDSGHFRVANLARFFRELQALLEEHAGDVAPVLRAVRADAIAEAELYEGRPADPDDDAVRVLTIHGAKGLDFEHVYLMQLHKGSRAPDDRFTHEIVDGRVEWRLVLPRLRVASLGWASVAARREAVARAESVRTLYVALTRAKSRVVMAGSFDAADRGAATHAAWIASARGPALDEARTRILAARASGTGACEAEIDGAVVRWLGLAPIADAGAAAPRAVVAGPSLDAARADSARLAELDTAARRRAGRQFLGRASEHAVDADRERRADAWWPSECDGGADRAASSSIAAIVGSAVHVLLERVDWSAVNPEAAFEQQAEVLRAAIAGVPAPQRDAARARAEALLSTLRGGVLWERLRTLAPHTLARELPVLLPGGSGDADPVGGVVGTIDWIYRDPATREVVVVDFKTDRVATVAEIDAKLRGHRAQAERYRRAAEQSLGLSRSPRVELWFLAADRCVPVDPSGAAS